MPKYREEGGLIMRVSWSKLGNAVDNLRAGSMGEPLRGCGVLWGTDVTIGGCEEGREGHQKGWKCGGVLVGGQHNVMAG